MSRATAKAAAAAAASQRPFSVVSNRDMMAPFAGGNPGISAAGPSDHARADLYKARLLNIPRYCTTVPGRSRHASPS
jgi:hypothetical protein